VQGYNAQAVTTGGQIVIAAEVTVDSPDFGHLEPMVTAAETELAAAGITEAPAIVCADAGDWHHVQMQKLTGRGTVVQISPDAGKRKGARPGWDGGLYQFIRRVLATDRGGELDAKRKGMIEPCSRTPRFNRRIDHFQRRGQAAARSEWRLITATHHPLKLRRHTTDRRRPDGPHPHRHPAPNSPTRFPRKRPDDDFARQPPWKPAAG
jgi:hypothetical protein